MIPGIYNIKAYRNDTMQYTFTITDADDNAISLANAAVKMEVRKEPDGEIVMTLTEGDGISVTGANSNVINVSKLVDINYCGNLFYDIQATFSSGVVSTYVKGLFIVFKDITT